MSHRDPPRSAPLMTWLAMGELYGMMDKEPTNHGRTDGMGAPLTQYARAGDVNIAYQMVGDGPVDLLWVGGLCSNLEVLWEEPAWAAFMRRLGESCRVVVFDRRGCGVSDRGGATTTPALEERMEDITAVLDTIGSEQATLFGFSDGGLVAAMFAATHPERVTQLILYGTLARFLRDAQHPWGWFTADEADAFIEWMSIGWGKSKAAPAAAAKWAPSLVRDERFTGWLAKWTRQSLSRREVVPFLRACLTYDLFDVFPAVRVPTLVMHRTDDALVPVSHGRWIAQHVPNARLVELPGLDHFPFVGDAEGVANEIEMFVGRPRAGTPKDRRLLTVVVTDVARAPAAATMNDDAWRELLAAHDREVDARLNHFSGRRVNHLGEGFLAVFDAPARAIRCAAAIVDAADRLGLGVRVGVHCGECELVDDDVQGIAVHMTTRIASEAAPGEVLVSGTVRDLVPGSGIRFGPGRDIEMQALPGRRSVFPVVTEGAAPEDVRHLAIEQANLLSCDGDYWTIAYEGQVATVRDIKGFRDLARLLSTPGREIHVLDLVADGSRAAERTSSEVSHQLGLHMDQGTGEPAIDETARDAYRQRITELEHDLDAAEQMGDTGAAAHYRSERDALVDHLVTAYGLGGRPRRTSDHVERARKTVSRRIHTMVTRVEHAHPQLGRHLRTALRTGVFCSYQPDRALHWTIRLP